MKIRAMMLGGATLLLAATSMTYASQPPSSPAERAQTDALNNKSLQAAKNGQDVTQAVTSDAATTSTTTSADDSAAAHPAAMPRPQVAQNNMSAPPMAAAPLSSLSNPPAAIDNASVVDNAGMPVGAVQKVELGSDGVAQRVDVTLQGEAGHVVAIKASSLTYDASKNILTAQASAAQIKAMPILPQG